jgi:hypothetical protein
MPGMKRSPFLFAAGLACLAAAPAAMADSIVYVDGGNVWSASPDGGHKVQLTDGGNWHSPTQADDGTIAAVDGTGPIQVMARDGRPLRTITTQPASSSNGGTFPGVPTDLSFSADGSKIAYSYYAHSCPVASSCGAQRSTFYTEANVSQATPQSVWGNQFGVSNPEWVTGSRTLVFGGAGSQVSIDDLDSGEDYSHTAWMTPSTDMGDGEVARDGSKLAVTFDYGDDTLIAFYAVTGDVRTEKPPAIPQAACNTSSGDARHADPTWAPDSAGIAFQSSKGIEVARFREFGPNHCVVEDIGSGVLTPTGETPDWGPADPPAARWTPPANGGGGGVAKPLALRSAQATQKALRKGLVVRLHAPTAGRVKVKLSLGGRKLASGSAMAKAPGTVQVRLSGIAKGRAKRLSGKTVTLTATQAGAKVTGTLALR